MTVERHVWVRVANFGVGWEADLAVARLDAEGIPARASGNDLVGIFGPGFQGATARGFFVEVPTPFVTQAQAVFSRPPIPVDEEAYAAEESAHTREESRHDSRDEWPDEDDGSDDEAIDGADDNAR